MVIHVVKQGETINQIASQYGVSESRIIFDNQISNPNSLIVGQALLILIPLVIHKVRQGETIYSIAELYNITSIQLIRNNPFLITAQNLEVGQSLVITYMNQKIGNVKMNGYAYPYINSLVLAETLPYLSELSIFSYGFTTQGDLIPIDDVPLIQAAREAGVAPILVLTPFGEDGNFNNNLVSAITNDPTARSRLIQNLLTTVRTKGYAGVDVDFEYILASDRYSYANFVSELRVAMNAEGYKVSVALAPKTSSTQAGLLYEGIDYQTLGQSADSVLVMTYEWGYTYGPPMAVAPINKVREVLDFAVSQIPSQKIDMGLPNYGYDWALPFVRGTTKADLIGNIEAIDIALRNNAVIQYDDVAQSPYFEYVLNGIEHVVWFEDARSMDVKLRTIKEYGFRGGGYWNLMRYFRANWLIVNALFNILRN